MCFKKKEKRSFVDDEEIILQHLLSLPRNSQNKIFLGLNSYNKIDGWEPQRFVQTLFLLKDRGYLTLYFYGHNDESAACDVTLKESAITYFEDQSIMEDEDKASKQHDYALLVIELVGSALFGFIIGRITG